MDLSDLAELVELGGAPICCLGYSLEEITTTLGTSRTSYVSIPIKSLSRIDSDGTAHSFWTHLRRQHSAPPDVACLVLHGFDPDLTDHALLEYVLKVNRDDPAGNSINSIVLALDSDARLTQRLAGTLGRIISKSQ